MSLLGLFKKKTGANSSVLSGQKPRRRRHNSAKPETSHFPLAAKFALGALVVCVTAIAFTKLTLALRSLSDQASSALQIPVTQWQIQVTDADGSPLSDELRKDIHRVVQRAAAKSETLQLEKMIEAIEALGNLEQVTVVRPRFDTLTVSASVRKPVLLVGVGGRLRFLTSDGNVYGEWVEEHSPTSPSAGQTKTPYPVLSGVFDTRTTPLQFDHSQKLVLTGEERKTLLDGLGLYRLAAKQAFELKALTYQGYRGFGLLLDDGTEVILGQPAFEYKLEKLLSIIGKLKSQGTTASRIELDYDGKAFIKERKL